MTTKTSTLDGVWNGVEGVIRTVAPTIATALGGPLAGGAVNALSNVIFGQPGKSPQDIAATIASWTPDQYVTLQKAELDYKSQLDKLGIDLATLVEQDRDSARKREIEVKDRTPAVMGYIVLGAFVVYSAASSLMTKDLAFMNLVVGYLAANASAVTSYFFGGSADLLKVSNRGSTSTTVATPGMQAEVKQAAS